MRQNMNTCDGVYTQAAKVLGIAADQIAIQYKPLKTTTLVRMENKQSPFLYPDNKTFYYSKLTDYKEVSFACAPNGFWKLDLLKLCHPACQTVAELRKQQTGGIEKLSDNALLTLAGLKILQVNFAAKKNCWALIEAKAFNALAKELSTAGQASARDDIQKLVNAVHVDFNTDPSSYK